MSGRLIWTWFRNMRTVYGKLKKVVSGLSAKPFTAHKQWVWAFFEFLESHLLVCAETRTLGQGGKEEEERDEDNQLPDLHARAEQ